MVTVIVATVQTRTFADYMQSHGDSMLPQCRLECYRVIYNPTVTVIVATVQTRVLFDYIQSHGDRHCCQSVD